MVRFLAAAALFLAGSASAQIPDALASQVLPNVNLETITPVLRNVGLTPESANIAGEEAVILRSGPTVIIMRPRVCAPDCRGLLIYSVFQGSSAAQSMNIYNRDTPPTSVFTASGNTVLARYMIADYGVTAGSFLANIQVFDNTVTKWAQGRQAPNAGKRLSVSLNDKADTPLDEDERAFLAAVLARDELYSSEAAIDY